MKTSNYVHGKNCACGSSLGDAEETTEQTTTDVVTQDLIPAELMSFYNENKQLVWLSAAFVGAILLTR